MVRSTTLLFVALSISAVFAGSSPAHHQRSRQHQLARRSHPSSQSTKTPRSASKTKRCAASSGNSTTVSVTSTHNSTSHHSNSTSGSSSDSGSSSNSTSTDTGSFNDGGSGGDTGSSSNSTSSNDGGSGSSSSSSDSSSSGNGALPSGTAIAGWTTVQDLSSDVKNVQTFTLSDDTFIIKNAISALPHPVVQYDGAPAMHIHYDAGSYDLKTSPSTILGGFSFYTPGPGKSGSSSTPAVDLAALKAREVSFGYSAYFSSGFDFNKGGKMPGMMGGTSWDTAVTASGGNHPTDGFSTRMMFRPNGEGELYMYIPPSENRSNLCGKTGTGQCSGPDAGNGKTYGATVGTGNFYWKAGAWTTIRQDIYLNTPGQKDGWAKVYVNGASEPAITITDISYGGDGTYLWGQQCQSFFGGHDPSWANSHAEDLYLKDFSIFVHSVFD